MAVEKLTDRRELGEFLMQDRLANAYLLGDLDPAYYQFCHWYGSRDAQGELRHVMLVYVGLSLPVVILSGNGEGLEEFLEDTRSVVPDRFHYHVLEEQFPALQAVYETESAETMLRMGLERDDFAPPERDRRVERLGHRDTAAIMALYEHYPDNFFEPYQLETGFYFGIRNERGRPVSMGGVHVISEDYDVAVIGNLVTHAEYRGQGLATKVTARLVEELFERVSMLALNVGRDNPHAVKLYENFGFEANNVFYEGRWSEEG